MALEHGENLDSPRLHAVDEPVVAVHNFPKTTAGTHEDIWGHVEREKPRDSQDGPCRAWVSDQLPKLNVAGSIPVARSLRNYCMRGGTDRG